MNKKSMSVTEMRLLLGIGKTDSYWLVKKGYFETVIIAGKMRVIVDSFEKWYDNQLHYKKVDGTPPGKNWTGITFSVREVAELLCISDSSVYELLKKMCSVPHGWGRLQGFIKTALRNGINPRPIT